MGTSYSSAKATLVPGAIAAMVASPLIRALGLPPASPQSSPRRARRPPGGGAAVTVAGDLTEEAPAAKLIEAGVERLGGLDILVNNVGGSRNRKIWEMPVEDW